MSVGTYGTIRSADVAITDIDMFYTYAPDRQTLATNVYRLDPTQVLSNLSLPVDEQVVNNENLLEGLYNLKLPASIFNNIGIYTIFLRPKVIKTTIVDCSVLSSLPSVKGIAIDSTSLPSNLASNNSLQGFKIEYISADGTKLRNVVRYVVSSNKVVPISQNIGNTSDRSIRYRFDDSGSLVFLQLTPSSSTDVKPNVLPFIGTPGQTILLSNTFFTPLAIEVELVKNDIDSVINIVGGEQIKDVNNGILSYYDENRNIIAQFNLFEIKDSVTNVSLYEVKEKRTNIDSNETFDNVTSGL